MTDVKFNSSLASKPPTKGRKSQTVPATVSFTIRVQPDADHRIRYFAYKAQMKLGEFFTRLLDHWEATGREDTTERLSKAAAEAGMKQTAFIATLLDHWEKRQQGSEAAPNRSQGAPGNSSEPSKPNP